MYFGVKNHFSWNAKTEKTSKIEQNVIELFDTPRLK